MYSVEEVAPGLSAYAATIAFNIHEPQEATVWQCQTVEFFDYLSSAIKESPQTLIGHLKGYLDLKEKGYYYFSNVGSAAGTYVKGKASGQTAKGRLDLNVLVFNRDVEQLSKLVQEATKKFFPGNTEIIEDINED